MPLLRRARAVAVCTALLATGWLAVPQPAVADVQPAALPGCSQAGPTLRYLVVFDEGTPPQSATSQIAAACGATAVYYPEIAVAVATSPDPSFVRRIGPNRAYSAAAEAYDVDGGPGTTKKPDETTGHDAAVTTTPSTVPTANRTDDQWDMTMIKADEAHKITDGSSRVLVGVLDSGIDPNHPDLAGSLDTADSAGCVTGVPDTNESAWEPTTSAHGTHVAGTIAGADNGEGTTGVAPGVRVAVDTTLRRGCDNRRRAFEAVRAGSRPLTAASGALAGAEPVDLHATDPAHRAPRAGPRPRRARATTLVSGSLSHISGRMTSPATPPITNSRCHCGTTASATSAVSTAPTW